MSYQEVVASGAKSLHFRVPGSLLVEGVVTGKPRVSWGTFRPS